MIKKLITSCLVILIFSLIFVIPAFAGGWYYYDSNMNQISGTVENSSYDANRKFKFKMSNGTYARNKWIYVHTTFDDGSNYQDWWYYFGNDAYNAKGWFQVNDKWYYADDDTQIELYGALTRNWMIGDYYFGHDCAMVQNNWFSFENKWYYAGSDGKILKNTTTPDGYWVNDQGIWK